MTYPLNIDVYDGHGGMKRGIGDYGAMGPTFGINDTMMGSPNYSYFDDQYYTHDIYYYKSFDFERPLFLYFWTPLICLTTLANVLVILVLIRKNMRTSTNIILTVIACTDALTGLVTIPLGHIYSNEGESGVPNRVEMTEGLCKTFMFLRYFLSRSFHTMSIWLTVLLAFERMVLVRYPFKAIRLFTIKRTGYIIAAIIVVSPFLHVYHAIDVHLKRVFNGVTHKYEKQCVWNLESHCKDGCYYMWSVFHLMHFVPCVLLITMSTLMIHSLFASNAIKRSLSMRAAKNRESENKRVLLVVLVIVIVFLIPETMYGLYRLIEVSTHLAQAEGGEPLSLVTRRRFRIAYEILLVLSFHANFWIYLVMNKKFRRGASRLIFGFKCCKVCGLYVGKETERTGSDSQSTRSRSLGNIFKRNRSKSSDGSSKASIFSMTTTNRIGSTVPDHHVGNKERLSGHAQNETIRMCETIMKAEPVGEHV